MRRLAIVITLLALCFTVIVTSTYAWLTYVQKKGFVGLETHELSVVLEVNDQAVLNSFSLDDLAFIDYEKDFVLNETGTLNDMASAWLIKLSSANSSPLAKHKVDLDYLQDGLICLLIYQGMNDELSYYTSDYASLVELIISGYDTKEEQLQAIAVHNQIVLDEIYKHVFNPGDFVEFQIVVWGDYDEVELPNTYLDSNFNLTLAVETVNSKGEVTP